MESEIARLEATMKMYEVQLANPVVQQDLDEMSKISMQIEETQKWVRFIVWEVGKIIWIAYLMYILLGN